MVCNRPNRFLWPSRVDRYENDGRKKARTGRAFISALGRPIVSEYARRLLELPLEGDTRFHPTACQAVRLVLLASGTWKPSAGMQIGQSLHCFLGVLSLVAPDGISRLDANRRSVSASICDRADPVCNSVNADETWSKPVCNMKVLRASSPTPSR